MNSTLPTSSPAAKTVVRGQHVLRLVAFAGLATVFVALLALAIAPLCLASFGDSRDWGTIAALVIVPTALLLVARHRRWSAWRQIAGGYLLLAPVLAYLTTDEPVIRRPMTLEEIAPAFPDAEKSFKVLLRYGKQHPLGQNFKEPRRFEMNDGWPLAKRREYMMAHRAELDADWAELAPVRAWWDELNAFDRIGDLTEWGSEAISFGPFRSYQRHVAAIASLQAVDGRGDAAFGTLLPLLEVARKLEPSSRTLVRTMVARVLLRQAIETADFVLDTTPVSTATRARFANALSAGSRGEAGARRMIALEYAQFNSESDNTLLGDVFGQTVHKSWLTKPLNLGSPILYNPIRTLNAFGDLTAGLQELAAKREGAKMNNLGRDFFNDEGRARFKNLMGSLVIGLRVPAYSKVTDSYWKADDQRAALLLRLTAS